MRPLGSRTRWILLASLTVVVFQAFLPPIVGLANQGDFRRVIGTFGYGPEEGDSKTGYLFVAQKYVPDRDYRLAEWEMPTSEYIFVEAALWLNKVISKDGKLDITAIGCVHAALFLLALWRLLSVYELISAPAWLAIATVFVATDVAYIAYFNSFYTEPATIIFFIFVLADTIFLSIHGGDTKALVRWTVWAALFLFAKPQNAPLMLPLAVFPLLLRSCKAGWASAIVVIASGVASIVTSSSELKNTNAYNVLFLTILGESKDPAADLRALHLDPDLIRYKGTARWGPGNGFDELAAKGVIGKQVSLATIVRFYVSRPTRLWRHVRIMLPQSLILRTHYGNFEISAGYPPMTRSDAFSLWSGMHRLFLVPIAKWILFALFAPSLLLFRAKWRQSCAARPLALLAIAGILSFLAVAFGDALDNVKHFFLYNLITDTFLLCSACLVTARRYKRPFSV